MKASFFLLPAICFSSLFVQGQSAMGSQIELGAYYALMPGPDRVTGDFWVHFANLDSRFELGHSFWAVGSMVLGYSNRNRDINTLCSLATDYSLSQNPRIGVYIRAGLAGGGFSWDEGVRESGRFTVYYLFGGAFYYSVGHGVKVQTGYYNYRPSNRSLASAFAQPFWGLSLEIGKL